MDRAVVRKLRIWPINCLTHDCCATQSGLGVVCKTEDSPQPGKYPSAHGPMNLIYLALDCPLPANNGLRMRTWSLLRALRAEGCRITLICQQASETIEFRSELRKVCESFWILDRPVKSLSPGYDWLVRLRSVASALPHSVLRSRSASVQTLLQQLWEYRSWDGILCDSVFAAINVPDNLEPLVVNHHNIEHHIFDSYPGVESNTWKRAVIKRENRKICNWEMQVGRRAALHLVGSDTDRGRLLQQQPGARVAVAPDIPPDWECEPDPAAEDPYALFLPGALDGSPNRNAVDYFLAKIWPLLLRLCPKAHVTIAGRNPPAMFLARHRHHAQVHFTGAAASMQPHLARASVVLAPLLAGSGTRLQILEAAAIGKCVVSTALAAEGLKFTPGQEIFLAESPLEFAQTVARLLRSPELRRRTGRAARERIQSEYSFAALRRSLRFGLQSLGQGALARSRSALSNVTAIGA